jgi:hypothetical protein
MKNQRAKGKQKPSVDKRAIKRLETQEWKASHSPVEIQGIEASHYATAIQRVKASRDTLETHE